MAKKISSLSVVLGATAAPFVNAFSKAGAMADALRSKVTDVGSTIFKLTGIGAVVGAAFGALRGIGSGIGLAAELEQTEVAFTTMLGSADAAKAMMSQLSTFAASTPFEFPGIASAAKSLLAFGVSAGDIPNTLRMVGDVAAGVGVSLEDLAQIYGKAKTSGKLMAEDINQLTGRGIPIIKELAKQFGVSEGEVKGLVTAGQVGFPQLQKAFESMTGKGGQFAGLMAAQSKTLGGLWSTLTDNIGMTLAGLVRTIVDAFGLRDALVNLTNFIGNAGSKLNSAVARIAPVVMHGFQQVWSVVQPVMTSLISTIIDLAGRAVPLISPAFEIAKNAAISVAGAFIAWKTVALSIAGVMNIVAITTKATAFAMAAWSTTAATVIATSRVVATAQLALKAVLGGVTIAFRSLTSWTWISTTANTVATAGMTLLRGAYLATRTAIVGYVASVRSMTAAQILWKTVTSLVTGTVWLLNTALSLNPIGLVVVAVGALAAGLVYLAKKFEIVGTLTSWASQAMKFATYTFENFGTVARFAGVAAAYAIVRVGNEITHVFTVIAPAMLKWFGRNWKQVFQTAFDFVTAVFTNMGKNIWNFFKSVKDMFTGKGFSFEWTSLTEGFENTLEELPKIADRHIGPLEQKLSAEMDRLRDVIKKGMESNGKPLEPVELIPPNNADRLRQLASSAWDKLRGLFNADEPLIQVDTTPAEEGLGKVEDKAKKTAKSISDTGNILFGSAEQMARMASARTYTTEGGAAGKSTSAPSPAAASAARDAGRSATAASSGSTDNPLLTYLKQVLPTIVKAVKDGAVELVQEA